MLTFYKYLVSGLYWIITSIRNYQCKSYAKDDRTNLGMSYGADNTEATKASTAPWTDAIVEPERAFLYLENVPHFNKLGMSELIKNTNLLDDKQKKVFVNPSCNTYGLQLHKMFSKTISASTSWLLFSWIHNILVVDNQAYRSHGETDRNLIY